MTQVNPPYVIKKLRPRADIASLRGGVAFNNYLDQLERTVEQLYRRTGSSDDEVEGLNRADLYEPGIQTSNADELVESLETEAELDWLGIALLERLEALEEVSPDSGLNESIELVNLGAGATAYTTTGSQFVTCSNTAAMTVTLNAYPEDGENVEIVRRDALVTVSGDVAGGTSFTIRRPYDAPSMRYSAEHGEWLFI